MEINDEDSQSENLDDINPIAIRLVPYTVAQARQEFQETDCIVDCYPFEWFILGTFQPWLRSVATEKVIIQSIGKMPNRATQTVTSCLIYCQNSPKPNRENAGFVFCESQKTRQLDGSRHVDAQVHSATFTKTASNDGSKRNKMEISILMVRLWPRSRLYYVFSYLSSM